MPTPPTVMVPMGMGMRQCVPCAAPAATPVIRLYKERQLNGHTDRVFDVSWSPASSSQPLSLASVGQKGGYVWDLDGGERIPLGGNEVMRVCWHLDGRHVLTGDSGGQIRMCAAADGKVVTTLEAGGKEKDEVYGLQMLSADGLLAAGAGNQVQQWDLTRGTCVARTTFETAESGFIFGGADRNPGGKAYLFSLDARGRALCAALSDGTVRLMDSQTLQTVGILSEHAKRRAPVFGVALSQRSPLLATSDAQGAVLLWDLRQMEKGPLAETQRGGGVHGLAFVPGVGDSSEFLAAGANDRTLALHETKTESLATESSVNVLSALLCVKASVGSGAPRLATAGGSGGLISDASISLWLLEEGDGAGSEQADGAKRTLAAAADGEAKEGVEKKQRREIDESEGEIARADDSTEAGPSKVEDCCSKVEVGCSKVEVESSEVEDCCSSSARLPAAEDAAAQSLPQEPSTSTEEVPTMDENEILVCQAGACRRAGSEAVLLEIEELGKDSGCTVRPEGCMGECDQAPNVIVVKDGEEQLHTRVDKVERSAEVVAEATGRAPNLDDPALTQRLTATRRLRARQRAREERKWNASMKGLVEQILNTADTEAQLELKSELAELLQSAGQWEAALPLLRQQLVAAEEDGDPEVFMQVGTLLGRLGKLAELEALEGIVARTFADPDEIEFLTEINRHLASCKAEGAKPVGLATDRRVEGYARWTLASVEPVSRHSALYRFTTQDRMRGTPHPRGHGRRMVHKTWHTTLLAMVGSNAEGPLLWVERDYTPISNWIEWEKGKCDILIKIYPTGLATSWLHKQPVGSTVWLSEPMITLKVPTLVPEESQIGVDASEYGSVLLVLAGTGIAVAASVLHHADSATSFGTANGRRPPLTMPISMIYACRRDDVLMASDIAKWCGAEPGSARLQRCVVAVSEQDAAAAAPFPTSDPTLGLPELAPMANVDVVDGRLTRERLHSELLPLQARGRCRVVVSGPASFNGAVKEMLTLSGGVASEDITILEA